MSERLLQRLGEIVGAGGILSEPALTHRYLTDWRGIYSGAAIAVVRPANAQEVARTVQRCAEDRIAIVPQGGNTGLAAGATPVGLDGAIVLSLERLNRVREIDLVGGTIVVEAGCVLSDVADLADRNGRLFPLSLAAEGTAQIGGLISTNAGGTAVLRYGTMRSLVLGLEVVLPDGRLVDGLRALRKDNAGYDWKHLFVGAEGTLGIVTAAVLRIFPKPRYRATAMLGVSSPDAALRAFSRLQSELGDTLEACELFPDIAIELRRQQGASFERPMAVQPWYLLVEAAASIPGLREAFETALAGLMDADPATDCVLAESSSQSRALWAWREEISETEKRAGASAKHDVSVPISAIASFVEEAAGAVEAAHPLTRVLAFGHLGDGNVHFNVLLPPDGSTRPADVNATVHAIVARYRGSITAEHGIGRYRRDELALHRSDAEMDLMHAVKRAIDPHGLMNPGSVL